jgi:hypothetical protein
MTFDAGPHSYEDLLDAVERLQGLLTERGQRQFTSAEQEEYQHVRRALIRDPEVKPRLPRLVTLNSHADGVWSDLRDHSGQWEPRRMFVREQMRDALTYAMEAAARDTATQASRWTGIQSQRERLVVARKLLPLAQATVEGLIAELERPQGNGGPPLDERAVALEHLKALHIVLGECIAGLEQERDKLDQKLLNEAAGYVTRAARSLRDDPMPYLVSTGLAGIFALLGAGELGGFLAGMALNVRRNASQEK